MLTFWELSPSPNNVKVRLALGYKGIAYRTEPVDPFDRTPLREVSGQDLSPVIQDKGIVLTDSEAILEYLDANYPDTPRLMPREGKHRYACDAWKRRTDKELWVPFRAVFLYALKRAETLDEDARAAFVAALRSYDAELGDRDSFHDDPDWAICDLRVVQWAAYAVPPEGLIERVGLFKKFRGLVGVEADQVPSLVRLIERWSAGLNVAR